jgi:hypothetical protein
MDALPSLRSVWDFAEGGKSTTNARRLSPVLVEQALVSTGANWLRPFALPYDGVCFTNA